MTQPVSSNTILRLHAVIKKTGLSRSTIYASIKENNFPKPISLGARSVGWLEKEIDGWIESRICQSRKEF